MSTKQPIWKNGKIILSVLTFLLIGAIVFQSIIAQPLFKKYGENPEKNSVVPNSSDWEESWSLDNEAISKREYKEAEDTLKSAISKANNQAEKGSRLSAGLSCLALIYEKQGKHEEAGTLYEKAFKILDDNPGKGTGNFDIPSRGARLKSIEKSTEKSTESR
ncbi:MAG: hypothetical protein K8F91_07395 [Candidatus Obscuribacterales bacterium]|nr:hypothetical protein [Candidatus Obscuribacterales bacterium]